MEVVQEVNKNVPAIDLLMLPWVDLAHPYLMASTFSQVDRQTLRKDKTRVLILQLYIKKIYRKKKSQVFASVEL